MLQTVKPKRSNRNAEELKSWLGALAAIKILETRPDVTLPTLCHELAATHGETPALIGAHETLTYSALSAAINRYAGWAAAQARPGETISLLMPNCPEYAAIWLGISQAGCATALLNTSLAADGLVHCITAAASDILMFSASFLPVVEAAMPRLPPDMRYFMHGAGHTALPVQRIDIDSASAPLASRETSAADVAVLIYTSGTTGLPKAARLTHGRLIEWSFWFAGLLGITPEDRMYDCLPMYHSTGGIVAIGAMLVRGGAVVIRERFSATRFWDDIIAQDCTMFMYIGELCRYLTQNPPRANEAQHRLRLCCGNGLSGDVWESFQARFEIPRIIEFYAATEGSVSLYNCAGKPGAIGHVPAFLAHNFPLALVKIDPVTNEILRGPDGLATLCDAGEAGEALGKIAGASHLPSRRFDGYTDAQASNRKITHGILAPGDAWFRTGDVMRRDANWFYEFVERLGETFRWKGENVSAAEVTNIIRACPGVIEAIVFGIPVPGHEGRAGMAVIKPAAGFTFEVYLAHLAARLPDYARPVFVKRAETLEMTGTFKYKKDQAAQAGSLFTAPDPHVWVYDRRHQHMIPADAAFLTALQAGTIRL
jgi:fatty-acyl-CoA synthase